MKNLIYNFWFHLSIMAVCAVVMVIDVIATDNNSLSEMTLPGKIAGYIFTADLLGWAFYVIVLKMIFKVK